MTSQQAVDYVEKAKAKLATYTPGSGASPLKKESKTTKKPPAKVPAKKDGSKRTKTEAKMESSIDKSQFKDLATVVEMIFEQNCPMNL